MIFRKIFTLNTPNEDALNILYNISYGNIFIMLGLDFFITLLLFDMLSYAIIVWGSLLLLLLLFRLYSYYTYSNNFNKLSSRAWYILYLCSSLSTAVFFSSLSVLFIPVLDNYYQLSIMSLMLGLSAGSMKAFSVDIRLSLVYLTILIFPLIIILFQTDNMFNILLFFSLILYYIAQVSMIIQNYSHELEFLSLRSKKQIVHDLFENAPIAMFIYNKELIIIDCNQEFLNLFSYPRDYIIGLDIHTLDDTAMISFLDDALSKESAIFKGDYHSLSGKVYWLDAKILPYSKHNEIIKSNIVLLENKTKEHHIYNQFKYLANHDPLTGLLNRRALHETMQHLIQNEKHKTHYSLLYYLYLNQFKGINDSLGHSIGDDVLLNVSQRLNNILNKEFNVFRLGGDEFIILYPFISKDLKSTKETSKQHIKYIQNIFSIPFNIQDLSLYIQVSVGITIIEPQYNNIEEIIRFADITMYQAKKSKSNIAYYNSEIDNKQKEVFKLQHDLAYAVDNNQLTLNYQPIASIKDNTIYAAEALIRWDHPKKGILQPDSFIPIAIKAGLMRKITWWVLHTICQQIIEWKSQNIWKLNYISINIDAYHFTESNFLHDFLTVLDKYPIDKHDIVVEITERSLIENFEKAQEVINLLLSHNIRCALDDFGVGYSSLSYLKNLSLDTLKIDKEFIKDIIHNPQEIKLLTSLVDIGHDFNYEIIIEGVEDSTQQELLKNLDENLKFQGYHFSKALPPEMFRKKFF